jgi:hypothetical protein
MSEPDPEIAQSEELARLRAENAALTAERDDLAREKAELRAENVRLKADHRIVQLLTRLIRATAWIRGRMTMTSQVKRIKETLAYGLDLIRRTTTETHILWSHPFQAWECGRCRQRSDIPALIHHTDDCIVAEAFRNLEDARRYVEAMTEEVTNDEPS